MGSQERQPVLADENQCSIDILQSLQNCDWFSQDTVDKTQVCLYHRNDYGKLVPTKRFPVSDFFTAVDFYQRNRDANFLANAAMQRPDGVVNVWTGHGSERRIAIGIKNYLVPQILEFAYLLTRTAQKGDSQPQS